MRKFKVPYINENAICYHQLIDSCLEVEPPLLHHLTSDDTRLLNIKLLTSHVKLVTQASAKTATVAGFKRRDGLIHQMINSRSLIKNFEFKNDLYNSFELVQSLFNKMTTNVHFG